MNDIDTDHFAGRWRDFGALDRMADHWYWRPGWRLGRSFYTWHFTFPDATDLHGLVKSAQDALRTVPGLSVVPTRWLHLTTQGVGFVGEVDESELELITRQTQARLRVLEPFMLELGPVDADAEGIGLGVRPWAPVHAVRTAIRDAIATVWGHDQVPEAADGFRPHLTIAYSASSGPAAPVYTALEPLRSWPSVTVPVDSVELIELNRDEKEYRWITRVSLPLGG